MKIARLILILGLSVLGGHAYAQQPVEPLAATQNTPTVSGAKLIGGHNDASHAIGQLLRCPVCQGMPISDSPADMAQSMMAKVRSMHAEGKSENEILKYFTDRYGEWVVLRPKASGLNWLVWLLPPVVLFLGIGAALGRSKRKRIQTPSENGKSSDVYLDAIRKEVEL